ncbi:GNAT family N-acetyltransferase [Thalassotalea ponticola]|uniref:GNAT family N-acetyltransferase n=1 Tax=Thalassotalea ponticola TaxID=1523392 RepID=UPI0025B4D7E9|nr:GNAT family N-acetyltransferase [Thalassotalea ponticola]MDN3651516.1 GNAT family N-acetyltransferase [Thalassotalea ponticola]
MTNNVIIRKADETDRAFIFSLSPNLAEVAKLDWHTDNDIQKMQENYISQMLGETSTPHTTLIAESNNIALGFIHVRTRCDDITGEVCGTIPLLAVSPKSQGLGIGKLLMASAEKWAKELGCRLIHLEVFANNSRASNFYHSLGFKPEMVHMIKTL